MNQHASIASMGMVCYKNVCPTIRLSLATPLLWIFHFAVCYCAAYYKHNNLTDLL